MTEWRKERPISPSEDAFSDWYWYWEIDELEPYVIEIWPGRYTKHLPGWWWPISIKKPSKKPKEEKECPKKRKQKTKK